MKNTMIHKTKRGGASMFVVMFTMIILSIITLGFTRLIISEAIKTSNTDLSQSAYDSALAGIEDAKMALLKYHACLDDGYHALKEGNECQKIIYYMETGIKTQDCSTVANVLRREYSDVETENTPNTENAVVIQETQNSFDKGNNANMLQAYTCVTIQEELEDYRTTLDSTNRLRIIPVRSSDYKDIKMVKVRWFSDVNYSDNKKKTSVCNNSSDEVLLFYPKGACNNTLQTPPTLSVRLIQTDETFDISQLSVSKSSNNTDTGQVFLVPSVVKKSNAAFSGSDNRKVTAENLAESANKGTNKPIQIACKLGSWLCEADIYLPDAFLGSNKSQSNTYLLVSLPYGDPATDISIKAYSKPNDEKNGLVPFTGVQARIDSTGRANDLYRRVESRVELVDTYFAYPEFEITMLGGDSSIKKNFDVTFNCWATDSEANKDWCDNTRQKETYTEL